MKSQRGKQKRTSKTNWVAPRISQSPKAQKGSIMTINFSAKTIALSASEMKAASKYNSDMYNALRDARNDNPGFAVVTEKAKKSKAAFAGLTKEIIAKYVEKNGTDEQKADFENLTKKTIDEDTLEVAPAASFFEIKKWFLGSFPEVKKTLEDSINQRNAIMSKVA